MLSTPQLINQFLFVNLPPTRHHSLFSNYSHPFQNRDDNSLFRPATLVCKTPRDVKEPKNIHFRPEMHVIRYMLNFV